MKLVSVETPEKSVCKMTFSATAEELEAASNAVYERTRATYTIKGFQKGEADRAQIEADRGEHTFWYDAINDLMDQDVPALYEAALKEHGFAPVDDPSYDLVSVKKDEGFVATATVALQPELKLTKTTGFTSQCVTPEVTDKEIDTVLERRRNYAAELVPHKGPAVKGNVVHMDFEGLLDGVAFKGGTAKDQSVQLGSGRMIPGFEDGILGHKAGDEFEINVTFPKNYPNKELAGKPAVFKIKLHDVCVRQLPALNSDFAKKMGKETMEEYRAFVKQQLFDGRHGGALNHAKDMILGQLADAAEGEIPSILVENAYQQQMQVIQQQLQMQRMSLTTYLGHKAGDEFEINVTFPKNYPNKELAGKPAVFKIKLHDVCVRQLPALNSDFAKKMGKETMEEYRAFVKQQLFDGRHGGALNHAKDMILGQLADAAEGEIPSILVENAYQQQMQVIQQQLQMQRMSLTTYLSQIHETRESFTAKVRAAAEKNTRARMALLQIAQQENLLPTDEEIDKQLAERAEKTKKTVEEIKAGTDVAALRRNEGIRKAADWVIDHSTIEEKVESK